MTVSRRWWVGSAWCALVVVAGLSSWLLLSSPSGSISASPDATQSNQAPDYLLRQAKITRFATAGTRRYVITSPEIVHRPQDNVTLLTTVALDYFPNAGTPWHLRADRGRLSEHDTLLELTGHVRARETIPQDPLRLETTKVTIILPAERLHSDARATMYQGHREMQGTGLVADLKAGTLSLLKDVSSRYVPH